LQLLHQGVAAHVFMVDYRGYGDRCIRASNESQLFIDASSCSQGDPSESALQQVAFVDGRRRMWLLAREALVRSHAARMRWLRLSIASAGLKVTHTSTKSHRRYILDAIQCRRSCHNLRRIPRGRSRHLRGSDFEAQQELW